MSPFTELISSICSNSKQEESKEVGVVNYGRIIPGSFPEDSPVDLMNSILILQGTCTGLSRILTCWLADLLSNSQYQI